eukprot:84843_1
MSVFDVTDKYIKCMDMSWISDFSNEQEVFCIGGLNPFTYKNIIRSASGINYSAYFGGLRLLQHCTETEEISWGSQYDRGRMSSLDKQISFRLLSDELYRYIPNHPNAHRFGNCPQYIRNIVHSHCKKVIHCHNDDNSSTVWNYLFEDQNTEWYKLDLITTVFPNIQNVQYLARLKNIQWFTQSSIYKSVLEYINMNKYSSLKKILIDFNPQYYDDISKFVTKYKSDFYQHLWSINVVREKKFPNIDFTYYKHAISQLCLNGQSVDEAYEIYMKKRMKVNTYVFDKCNFIKFFQNPEQIKACKIIMQQEWTCTLLQK